MLDTKKFILFNGIGITNENLELNIPYNVVVDIEIKFNDKIREGCQVLICKKRGEEIQISENHTNTNIYSTDSYELKAKMNYLKLCIKEKDSVLLTTSSFSYTITPTYLPKNKYVIYYEKIMEKIQKENEKISEKISEKSSEIEANLDLEIIPKKRISLFDVPVFKEIKEEFICFYQTSKRKEILKELKEFIQNKETYYCLFGCKGIGKSVTLTKFVYELKIINNNDKKNNLVFYHGFTKIKSSNKNKFMEHLIECFYDYITQNNFFYFDKLSKMNFGQNFLMNIEEIFDVVKFYNPNAKLTVIFDQVNNVAYNDDNGKNELINMFDDTNFYDFKIILCNSNNNKILKDLVYENKEK
jgi:hypothetical protein